MNTKTILVTGATDGIGMQTALELARLGHHVIAHGRNADRGQHAVDEIKRATKNDAVDLVLADFAELRQVRRLAAEVNTAYEKLDVLINNAGVLMTERVLSADGFEMTFAVNHLAHFLLTQLLLDRIKASAPARIVTVSSGVHRSGRIEWDNLNGERNFTGYEAYARSKLANVLFAYELAERLHGTGVTSNALHPGVVNTKLLHAGSSATEDSLARGAQTSVYLATSLTVEKLTGRYFDNLRETPSAPTTYNKQLRQELWRVSTKMVALKNPA